MKLSAKGEKLLTFYEEMLTGKVATTAGLSLSGNSIFNDFQARRFREVILQKFNENNIKTVLDYGCGGSDWFSKGFDTSSGKSAIEYFKLDEVSLFEPARSIDQKNKSDCVICFDVLEHIFISDLKKVIHDILNHASKLVILNVACYPASKLLPNNENVHVTQRPKDWWKGFIDNISIEYPEINIFLICTTSFDKGLVFPTWKANDWNNSEKYEIKY